MHDPTIFTASASRARALLISLLLLLACFASACGPSEEQNNDDEQIVLLAPDMGAQDMDDVDMEPDAPEDTEPELARSCEGDIHGVVYTDGDLNARSLYSQGPDEMDTPLVDHEVSLITESEERTILSCDGGEFGFGDIEDGFYVLEARREEQWFSSSSSQGLRFAQAVREGSVKVVVFGDSIPAYGPKPWFPTRFKGLLNRFAEVTLENVAVPGSTSEEWLPEGNFFGPRIGAKVKDADVIVFSLGGNDLYAFANTDLANTDVNELKADFDILVEEVKANIRAIITELREINPEADIVWLLYPNYAVTPQWEELAGDYIGIVEPLLKRTLIEIRRDMSHHERFMLWDMFEATKSEDLGGMLSDPLHLNAKGHEFYARELFKMLGGVIVADGEIDMAERRIGFGASGELEAK